ncbi:Bud-site selection protein [Sporormia fimetaria CBS 119925]|uniref:Bud-site selection protein n=1 Tax=Sporormia fimetaria CBS 119925 TaxID=1340428 RepID=A0A6A6V5G9_9PLEO|nr:Bud-site selection protein [Sporormia fimetaria CBS 119925]
MPKRKRPSPSPSTDDATSTLTRQKKHCTQILAASQKSLVSALRLGAGFERQKFSRRRKTAKEKKDDKAVERLDAEYAVLKGLDIPKLAEQHLRKTIGKVKSLKDHEALPENVKEVEKAAKDPLTLNVTARLYKVQGVKKVVDECIESLKKAVGVAGPAANAGKAEGKEKEKQTKRARVEEEDAEDVSGDNDDGEDAFSGFDARIAAPSSAEEDSDDSLDEGHRPPSVVDSDREYDIGGESDGSASESEDEAIPRKHGKVDDRGSDEEYSGDEQSDADDLDPSEDDASEDELKPASKKKAKGAAANVASSTFLPSLSHAAYYSGTESEASDLEDDRPKKNRRGQRARQKIWEKKFGEKAKHKQKEERSKGWDPKRGAVDDSRSRGPRTGRGPTVTGENATALGDRKKPPKRDDSGPLHPSWQAAKLAKEKKLAAKPAGTKIVFD